ncbi:MAG: beta-ketoacyl-[acyl-carrier-protein] synthase family protein [Dysgonamonadaceae bacterium]|jgi:3-oxoacyl-[acyl-carrier-protein] synthase-1|nr:beta-ketoacyl-[acyl-carrier-protein] synthase family protein [Dysgonamonadaceae bacterium]
MRVFIVDIGIISALGAGTENNLCQLLAMRHGLNGKSSSIDPDTGYYVGKVALTDEELSDMFKVRTKLSRTSLLSLYAVNECLNDFCSDCNLGFISGTTVGGMASSENFFRKYIPCTENPKVEDIIYHTCGSATTSIVPYLPKLNYISTINTACSSAANAIIFGAQKIKSGQLDAVIAGGSDSLCRFTLNGFQSLMILDENHCKPLDLNRSGLNLGEGAGYLLLMSGDFVEKHGISPLCELKSYANTNDAFHATALSDDGNGPYLSMKQTLDKANIASAEIDYINIHGTGTINNDLAESAAILRVFGEKYPSLSSTKAYTGHTLGASGGIEAVFSVLAIEEQKVFPNLNFTAPMPTGIIPVLKPEKQKIKYVLSNSFGFGGNCSSLLFSKI